MSGGYFDHRQWHIDDIANDIHKVIAENDDQSLDKRGAPRGRGYSPATISKFQDAVYCLRRASAMVHRIDWLLSGDDGEERLHERWDEVLNAIDEVELGME